MVASHGRPKMPTRTLLPNMLINLCRHGLFVVVGKGWIRQSRVDVVQDQSFYFGLSLFFLGPAFALADEVDEGVQKASAGEF